MTNAIIGNLLKTYRGILFDDVIPYWERHGLDRVDGGFLNCMKDNGERISEDKYGWSQGRGLWSFAHLALRFKQDPWVLEFARKTKDFLIRHARDENGDWANRLSRTGERLDGPISIYTDIFTGMGLLEYYRATGDEEALKIARQTAHRIAWRIRQPDFCAVAPFKLRPGHHLQGVLFLSLNLLTPLLREIDDPALEQEARRCSDLIQEKHMDPRRQLNLETLDEHYREVDYPEGRDWIPGHGIECAWMLMLEAQRRGDDPLMQDGLTVLRWHLEGGWDHEAGGIFWFLNIDKGEKPFVEKWDSKLLWPHAEALIALLLAYEFTREPYYMDWFLKVHEYTLKTFSDRENGEMFNRRDRHGNELTATLVLPVKDPFHWLRAVMMVIEGLERIED